MERTDRREPFEGARAAAAALVATTSGLALHNASLASWPLWTLYALAFSGGIFAAIAISAALETRKRWPWAPIAAAVAALAAGARPFLARILAELFQA